jgi:ATP-dependent NAD(P)H-hydrate dehydratase
MAKNLSQSLGGVTIVQKGGTDIISNGNEGLFWMVQLVCIFICLLVVFQCDIEGGLKRMGGQGDILSGAIAAFLAWGKAYEQDVWR